METEKQPKQNLQTILTQEPGQSKAAVSVTAQSSFNLKKILLFVLVLAVLAGVGAAYNFFKPKPSSQLKPNIPNSNVPGPSIENNQAMLLPKSKVVFPVISSSKDADDKVLPQIITKLMGGANATQVKVLTYENGQQGFLVTYPAPASVQKYPIQISVSLVNTSGVKILDQSFATYFAVTEFELDGQTFQIQQKADQEVADPPSTVTIQTFYGTPNAK